MSKSWRILKIIVENPKVFSTIKGCLFFVGFCLLSVVLQAQIKNAPSWVREVPINEDAYYGMGMVDMKSYPEYRAKARKMALKEVVEKIFVSISSNSSLTTSYEDEKVDYLLDETVLLKSSNFLSGHQKIEEWIDKRSNTYYVLFRLDIAIYKANRKVYLKSLETVIRFMQDEAMDLFKQGEVARGASKLIASINRLDEEMNRLIEPEYSISFQKWRLNSLYELEKQIDQIGFSLNRNYEFQATARQPLVIENFIINKSTGTPLNGLILDLKVVQGDVFRYSFDHEDHEALSIYGMFPQKGVAVVQITAYLKLDNKIRELLNPSVKNILESRPIVIQFVPYGISFNFDGKLDYALLEDNSVISYLRNITNDLGLKEVSPTNANYSIGINPIGRVIRHKKGYFYGVISVEVSITDLKNSREIYQYVLPQTKVRGRDPEMVLTKAFHRSRSDPNKFLEGFITSLCALHL
jgi:hypothetical protein